MNLKNLIQNVVESKNTEAKRRGIRILQTVDILHEDIVADAAKLMNILEKVLNNGVEFSKDEDVVQLKVEEIDSDRNTCTMRYTIKDLGVGMDDTSPKALFETFLDDSDESKDPNNLGLGLPIVKKLIDKGYKLKWCIIGDGRDRKNIEEQNVCASLLRGVVFLYYKY